MIFVAHAGLDAIVSVGDVWRRFPVDQVIRARWWRVPFDQVPREAGHEEQVQWLFGWWERIDEWITENRPGGLCRPRWRRRRRRHLKLTRPILTESGYEGAGWFR